MNSIANFNDIFTPAKDPEVIHVDFLNARVYDHSAIEAINKMAEKYEALNKELHLKHLSKECTSSINLMVFLRRVQGLFQPFHLTDL